MVALDCFGDADTRRAGQWVSIGAADTLRIDGAKLLDALDGLARRDAVQGWVVGGGFEGRPDLLEAGAERLPLVGNGAAVLRRVRDAQTFFAALRSHGIAHPPVRDDFDDFDDFAEGWLRKDFAGCGGQQVRWADTAPLGATQYLQQWRDGTPMSATYLADGRHALVLGCNRQLVQSLGAAPFVWQGAIGPVAVSAVVQQQVDAALQSLVAEFGLRGLGSLDFLLTAPDRIEVLEINPRWPASAELYAAAGVMRAHVQACEQARLPALRELSTLTTSTSGIAVVYARRSMHFGDAALRWLAAQPDVHDLPAHAATLCAHQPLCSVSCNTAAADADAGAVQAQLAQRRIALLTTMENFE